MSFIDATAIKACAEDASSIVEKNKSVKIPEHLKKVKKANKACYILMGIGVLNIPDGITVKVPGFKSVTKEQYEESCSHWPCRFFHNFVENVDLAQCMSNLLVTLEYYKSNSCKTDCLTENILNCLKNQIKIDEDKKRSLAHTEDHTDGVLLEHNKHFCSSVCLIFDKNRLLYKSYDSEYISGHAITDCISNVSKLKEGYLCTGFSAFLYQEPCFSCAMALVHGRIKNVFCFKKGGDYPFSKHKFNYNEFLNHRFDVYFYN